MSFRKTSTNLKRPDKVNYPYYPLELKAQDIYEPGQGEEPSYLPSLGRREWKLYHDLNLFNMFDQARMPQEPDPDRRSMMVPKLFNWGPPFWRGMDLAAANEEFFADLDIVDEISEMLHLSGYKGAPWQGIDFSIFFPNWLNDSDFIGKRPSFVGPDSFIPKFGFARFGLPAFDDIVSDPDEVSIYDIYTRNEKSRIVTDSILSSDEAEKVMSDQIIYDMPNVALTDNMAILQNLDHMRMMTEYDQELMEVFDAKRLDPPSFMFENSQDYEGFMDTVDSDNMFDEENYPEHYDFRPLLSEWMSSDWMQGGQLPGYPRTEVFQIPYNDSPWANVLNLIPGHRIRAQRTYNAWDESDYERDVQHDLMSDKLASFFDKHRQETVPLQFVREEIARAFPMRRYLITDKDKEREQGILLRYPTIYDNMTTWKMVRERENRRYREYLESIETGELERMKLARKLTNYRLPITNKLLAFSFAGKDEIPCTMMMWPAFQMGFLGGTAFGVLFSALAVPRLVSSLGIIPALATVIPVMLVPGFTLGAIFFSGTLIRCI